jgi:penicillin-binding protein 1A
MKKTARKKTTKKPVQKRSRVGVYSNLVYKRRMKADQKARRRAEDLASLPKQPVARFFARLHPKRVFRYWFSMDGLFRVLKFCAACFLLFIIAVGGLFLYFKQDLNLIRLDGMGELTSTTVNTYLDRNGLVLWQDRGDGDYRLSVPGEDISTYMRQATVALEDRNFYSHPGVDPWGLLRALWMTLTGQQVQGGSTLTQQLIKQVYFSDEASDRTLTGVPRKIKETILALEIEKLYDKEQIITMYLNKSPYGGRRNGVESGARTYFGKPAKDLTLAEATLLAAIPQNPSIFNPYSTNEANRRRLINRQHHALDVMVEMGYITREQAQEAKDFPILDSILPEASQYQDIRAPHFVLEVKRQLEEKYGVRTMRAGGFTITTTLDYRIQEIAEESVAAGVAMLTPGQDGDNVAFSAVDVETGQVVALVGSIDWERPAYGQVNAATALLEPGSTIKPLIAYAPLFQQRSGQNFGPGSILSDEDINALYCRGHTGRCSIRNFSGRTYGNVTIRFSLAESLNRPAVKAMYIVGVDEAQRINRGLGNLSYCKREDGSERFAGLSIAIGGGCGVRQIEQTNAYASFARGGVYKPLAYWLEVKNSTGDLIDFWEDTGGERIIDEQVAFMISDIMTASTSDGVPGVWTATKTGTSDDGVTRRAKDIWRNSYSTVISAGVWIGNHDGSALRRRYNIPNRRIINDFMENVHKNVYAADGKWKPGDRPVRPAGIQTLTVNGITDIWPSWYNERTSGIERTTVIFDRISRKMATSHTPSETRIEIIISKMVDPVTRREIWTASGGGSDEENAAFLQAFQNDEFDDIHMAGDRRPNIRNPSVTERGRLTATLERGTHDLASYQILVDGTSRDSRTISGSSHSLDFNIVGDFSTVVIRVVDRAGYVTSWTGSNGSNNND